MNRHLKHVLCAVFGLLALVLVLSLVSGHADARTATWDGGDVDDQLASSPDNWDLDTAPVAGDDIVFDGTSTESCTWDLATNSFGTFTIGAGYSGTVTQSSDMHITGYSQAGATFKGVITKMVYCDGSWIKTDGTLTVNVLNLVISGDSIQFTLNTLSMLNTFNFTDGSITIKNLYCKYLLNNGIITLYNGDGGILYINANGGNIINRGEINSLSVSRYVDFQASVSVSMLNTFYKGNGTSVLSFSRTGAVSDSTVFTLNNELVGTMPVLVQSAHITATHTLNLNGHSLTASTITVGTRGILTNTVGTSYVNCTSFTQSGVTSNVTGAIELHCSGALTISNGLFVQGADLWIGGFSQTGGTFTGITTKWVYCSGNFTKTNQATTLGNLKLNMSGLNNSLSLLNGMGFYQLTISGNISWTNSGGTVNIERVTVYGRFTISNILSISAYWLGGLFNYGRVDGTGTVRLNLYDASPTWTTIGIIDIAELVINERSDATGTRSLLLGGDLKCNKVTVQSQHATHTGTLNLNGHSLTATTITVGTRGILTDTVGNSIINSNVIINGASACLTQGTGKAITINGDLTLTLGYLNQTGTITLNGDYSQGGGTLTGSTSYWFYCSGNFVKTAGAFWNFVTKLAMSSDSGTLTMSGSYLNSLKISGNITVDTLVVRGDDGLVIEAGKTLTIPNGKNCDVRLYGVAAYSNNGVITTVGTGYFQLSLYDTDKSFDLGGIIGTLKISNIAANNNRKFTLTGDFNSIADITIVSTHATYTIALDTGGHSLTATTITLGARGILTNTHATASTIATSTFDSSNALGLFNGTNIILNMAGDGNLKTKATDIISDLNIPATTTLLSDLKVTNFLGITGSLVQGAYRVNITSSIAECLSITGNFSGSIYLDGNALSYRPTVEIPHGGTIYTNRQTDIIFTEGEFRVNPTGWVNITVLTWNVRSVDEEATFHMGGTAGNCEVEMLITHDRYYNLWIDNSASLMVGSPVNDIIAFDWDSWSSHYFILNPIPMFMVFPDEFGVCFERYYFDTEVNENATLSAVFDSPDLRFDNASGVLQGRLIQNYPVITVSIRADDGTGGVAYLNFTIDVDMLYWNIRATINVYEYGSLKVGFNFTSTTPNDLITSVIWNFGDGTGSKGFEGVHEYKRDGYYWVTLIVKDINGNVGRESYYLKVGNPSPNNVEPPAQDDFGPLYDLVLKLIGIGALALVTIAVYEAIKRGRMSGNQAILLLILLLGMTVALFVSVVMGVL